MHLSVVVPVYRSAECLPELARRVGDAARTCASSFELILVNDASPDASWQVIADLADRLPFVVGLDLR
jgi:glycosyltransferase involved in cell wall biosynthesis